MTKEMKIRRLQKQNDNLIEQNVKLRQKIPNSDYTREIDNSLDKFDDINDELLKLYRELHRCGLKNKRTALRYRFGIMGIRIKQVLGV